MMLRVWVNGLLFPRRTKDSLFAKPDSLVQGHKAHGGTFYERGVCNRETGNFTI